MLARSLMPMLAVLKMAHDAALLVTHTLTHLPTRSYPFFFFFFFFFFFSPAQFAVWERKPQCSNCHTSLPKAIRDRQKNVDKAERRRAAAEATSTS